MKKTIKLIAALSIILTIVLIGVSSYASINPGTFASGGSFHSSALNKMGQQIVAIVRTVGILISVVILLVLGIKYMLGSAEEKADYKKSMIPYIVGAVLIFSATTIGTLIYEAATAVGN